MALINKEIEFVKICKDGTYSLNRSTGFNFKDVKEALNCFEDNIATLYDEETQEQIKYFIKKIFGGFEENETN